jgi:hypothetical protein
MLTSAGVAAPDGNELAAWQTGIWGQFLRELQQHPDGLDHGWVSLFTFDPRLGAKTLAAWVHQLPNLTWIAHQSPVAVLTQGRRVLGVRFPDYEIRATLTLDGTELGDLLALGDLPHRWGWEWQGEFNEPSAPVGPNAMTEHYPVQSPTWVFLLRETVGNAATPIAAPTMVGNHRFQSPWERHSQAAFLSYGQLPDRHYMVNWPINGNDYGKGLNRLVGRQGERQAFLQEAYEYSYAFAHFLQTQHFPHLELATDIFPQPGGLSPAFALHPYYRESRRLRGQVTLTEKAILPQGQVAPLPLHNHQVTSIAIGNYANDHHYPGYDFPLAPKSLQWGGRWTGTPFTIPFGAVLPQTVQGLLPCEKNISVSHIANGSTRLQPLVMNTGQAVGMIAALSIEQNCDPQDLAVREVQEALIGDRWAPAAVIPLFNLTPDHPDWADWQRHYLDHPDAYPESGHCPVDATRACLPLAATPLVYRGQLHKPNEHSYQFSCEPSVPPLDLITVRPEVEQQLQQLRAGTQITVGGRYNPSGNWLIAEAIAL